MEPEGDQAASRVSLAKNTWSARDDAEQVDSVDGGDDARVRHGAGLCRASPRGGGTCPARCGLSGVAARLLELDWRAVRLGPGRVRYTAASARGLGARPLGRGAPGLGVGRRALAMRSRTMRSINTHSVPRIAAALLLLPALTSCGGDGDCWDCALEVSNGLVAADFGGSGSNSIVATSTVLQYAQINPGNLKIYLAGAPGSFAAPSVIPAGDDPLFLASADLNGDRLPDIVSASYDDARISVFLNEAQSPGTF